MTNGLAPGGGNAGCEGYVLSCWKRSDHTAEIAFSQQAYVIARLARTFGLSRPAARTIADLAGFSCNGGC